MPAPEEYKVRLDVFEGPLDLLLYLIRKDEVDIHDIPIVRVTNQYMQYLDLMKMLDLNFAGEFLVMAATLMMIKSRLLLPVEERPELEAEEEDPRWDLVRQLVEYKKFKDAAQHLEWLERLQGDLFVREGEGVELAPDTEVALGDVSLFDLISAFQEALKKVKPDELREIFAERFTVADKVEFLINLMQAREQISFMELLSGMTSRFEMVCTFLAILELIRTRQIRARQEERFGDIVLSRVE